MTKEEMDQVKKMMGEVAMKVAKMVMQEFSWEDKVEAFTKDEFLSNDNVLEEERGIDIYDCYDAERLRADLLDESLAIGECDFNERSAIRSLMRRYPSRKAILEPQMMLDVGRIADSLESLSKNLSSLVDIVRCM